MRGLSKQTYLAFELLLGIYSEDFPNYQQQQCIKLSTAALLVIAKYSKQHKCP